MLYRHQVTFSFSRIFAVLLLPVLLSSCAVITGVRKYPKNTPFVFKTVIKIEGNQSASDKQDLEARLQNQLDDSLKLRIKSFPLWKNIIQPPKFDTMAVRRSEAFMMALLNSLGYFSAKITDTFWVDTVMKKKQQRVTVSFRVTTGK